MQAQRGEKKKQVSGDYTHIREYLTSTDSADNLAVMDADVTFGMRCLCSESISKDQLLC